MFWSQHRLTNSLGSYGRRAATMLVVSAVRIFAADPREIVVDFERAEIGKPVPTWTEKDVVFSLASPLVNSKAAGRVTFFPYLPTERKGILNAMAQEQAIPLRMKFPIAVSSVTLVLWGSTACPAKVQAFDRNDRLVGETKIPAAPVRQSPADPVPQFELTVKAPAIAYIQLSGPRNGEFLAADEVRFIPTMAEKMTGWRGEKLKPFLEHFQFSQMQLRSSSRPPCL